jgi:hypothetical protein
MIRLALSLTLAEFAKPIRYDDGTYGEEVASHARERI